MANDALIAAQKGKNDEFYTQYEDIEKEMNSYLEFDPDVFRGKSILLPCDDPEWSNFTKYFAQNFETFGLKKLVSTSYAPNSKPAEIAYQPTLFEMDSETFDQERTHTNGKIFTLSRDTNGDRVINVNDLEWQYLEGDGDFRSDEIKALRNEADIVMTNPPFSLFSTFLNWILEAEKQFVILGNMTAITNKEVFPLIMQNKIWLGPSISSGDREFRVPESYPLEAASWRMDDDGQKYIRVKGVRWYTNIDHGRRHQPLNLMSESDNIKFAKDKAVRGFGYRRYENYDAIDVPSTASIPGDYEGVMGVPISFIDKYNPDQFEIVGMCENLDLYGLKTKTYSSQECKEAYFAKFGKKGTYDLNRAGVVRKDGVLTQVYARVLIRKRKAGVRN